MCKSRRRSILNVTRKNSSEIRVLFSFPEHVYKFSKFIKTQNNFLSPNYVKSKSDLISNYNQIEIVSKQQLFQIKYVNVVTFEINCFHGFSSHVTPRL